MAARTVLTPVQLLADAAVAQGSGTTIDSTLVTNGVTVAAPGGYHGLIVVKNSDTSSHNLIVRAGRSGVDAAGNAQTNVPADTVFSQATTGDLTAAVAASATAFIPVTTTSRFTQKDGSLSIDFSSGFTGTIWFFRGSRAVF